MGRLKFEKEFKEKLDHREIKPSENSWEKLSSQLNSEEKSTRFNFWWLGIAATIIAGIFIIGIQYRNSGLVDSPQVVDAQVNKVDNNENESLDANSIIKEEEKLPVLSNENISAKDALAENTEEEPNKKSHKPEPVKVEKRVKINPTEEKNIVIVSVVEPNIIQPVSSNYTSYSKDDEIITQKLSEVIAQVNAMNSEGNSVTDSEVDKLLAQAAKQIEKERDYNFSVGKINPEELLQSVEMDMEYSFREKIFDVLKEGYLKAKTAVANRNY